jgi:heptosyltransferase-2
LRERLLIVGPSWVGDMVMAQSLFISLRQENPEVEIDVVAPDWSRPLLDRMPEVREAIELPVAHGELHLATRWQVGRSLAGQGYQRAIVLPRSIKSALVPFFAGIPRRTGFRGEHRYGLINDMRPYDPLAARPMVTWYLILGLPPSRPAPEGIPYPRIRVDEENRQRLVNELDLDLDRPAIGCIPGAEYGPAKAWPLESYGELTRRLAPEGFQFWILGSEGEREAGERIRAASGGAATNLCGRTRLEDAADLLSLTSIVVSNDTGLMHVAAAVGSRVVAIFGSSSPRYTPPLTDTATVLYLDLDCSPCFERRCPFDHYRCLREITVESVLSAVRGAVA